ncbi:5-enolpyruvylshikimate-3-phosphate synthase [Actinoplanes lutulentus]|uniref:EPSP synthase (3-phosphoshikimate 1-carboxyvinyltransferase) n=1 Tax=Actinoplanes lutulentus TaxID=1287878 RepID=A0A327YZD9_9ACTN|nr:hypothetical protein [Actinoplanes lutulentus]MBB2946570.1 5-enolpyruvylshikimate-3-phosphate synthase [Actinoplanes lutulentus]RAK26488.1 EPSP synthase (3-phosphoshikimate 1-carboxyvinyltransferase) [Actinoplanes lutulentus]
MSTELIWPAPAATMPVRARLDVVAVDSTGAVVEAPTVDDAAVFLAGAAVTTGTVVLRNWEALAADPAAGLLRDLLATFGTYVVRSAEGLTCTSRATSGHLDGVDHDLTAAPGLAGIAVVLAALADSPSSLHGVSEAPRVAEVLENVTALGGDATVRAGVVEIVPGPLRAGAWQSHGDPRLGAFGAVLGLVIPGVRIAGLSPDAPGLRPFLKAWRWAMTADENILPGTSTGTVPYYG